MGDKRYPLILAQKFIISHVKWQIPSRDIFRNQVFACSYLLYSFDKKWQLSVT